MNCAEARERIQDQSDGLLSSALEAELLAHTHSCQACLEYRQQMAVLMAALESLRVESERMAPVNPATADLPTAIRQPRRSRWLAVTRIAAALALALGTALFFGDWTASSTEANGRDNGGAPPLAAVKPALSLAWDSEREYLAVERASSQANVRLYQLVAVVNRPNGMQP